MSERQLGVITKTFLGHDSHGTFTFVIHIDFGPSKQGFGTYPLSYRPGGGDERYHLRIGEAIGKICAAVGVECWEHLPGKTVYVETNPETGTLCSIEAPPFVPHGPAYNILEHLGDNTVY